MFNMPTILFLLLDDILETPGFLVLLVVVDDAAVGRGRGDGTVRKGTGRQTR